MKHGFLIALCLACGTAMQAGNILVNGDFQTGAVTPWTSFTTTNGSIGGAGFPAVVSFDSTGSGASLAAEFNVGKATSSSNPEGGGIIQSFNLATAGSYLFFANIASQDDATGQINGDPGTFSILIDGTTLASNQLGGGGGFSTAFQILLGSLSGSANLGAGSHSFEVLVTRSSFNGGSATPTQFVDNVSLTSTAAPEPGTFGIAGASLILLGLAFRRKANY